MSEADSLRDAPEVEPESQIDPQIQADPEEAKARERGWVPEEEFRANPKNEGKDWHNAHDFNVRGDLIRQIHGLEKKVEDIHASTRDLLKQNSDAVRRQTEERVRAELSEAVAEGDTVRAQKAADDLAKINQPESGELPEVTAFKARNDWYGKDQEMTAMANALDVAYANQGMTDIPARLQKVEAEVRNRLYRDRFENPNRERAPTAESGGYRPKAGKKAIPPLSSLPEEFQRVGRQFVQMGTFKTEADYVKHLIESGTI